MPIESGWWWFAVRLNGSWLDTGSCTTTNMNMELAGDGWERRKNRPADRSVTYPRTYCCKWRSRCGRISSDRIPDRSSRTAASFSIHAKRCGMFPYIENGIRIDASSSSTNGGWNITCRGKHPNAVCNVPGIRCTNECTTDLSDRRPGRAYRSAGRESGTNRVLQLSNHKRKTIKRGIYWWWEDIDEKNSPISFLWYRFYSYRLTVNRWWLAIFIYLFSFLALSKGRTRRDLSLRRTGVCQSVRDGIVSRRTLAILFFIFPFFFFLFLESRVNDVRIYQRIDGFCGPTMFDPLTERERKKKKESHTLKSSYWREREIVWFDSGCCPLQLDAYQNER